MHQTIRPLLIAVAVAVIVLAVRGRIYRIWPVVFLRSLPIDSAGTTNSRQAMENIMTQALPLPQTYRRDFAGFGAKIRAIARAVAAEHTLALRASTKAASPRQSLAELRAMYVLPSEPHQEGEVVARRTKSAY
jgi:hypothetical protein